mgnify:CR=1 FL=1
MYKRQILVLPYLAFIPAYRYHKKTISENENTQIVIIIKEEFKLYVYDFDGNILMKSYIALGKNFGDKQKVGDMKTPEGIFKVESIESSSDWTHDFKDDSLGVIEGVYGPFFIRLTVPGQKGIGIHGTHDPNSLGTRVSEGCIRMANDELINLISQIRVGTLVIITPSQDDVRINSKTKIK